MTRRGFAWVFPLVLLLWVSADAGFEAPADAIVGVWNTPDSDARIEIYRCGPEYCGRISFLQEPMYPPDDEEGMAGMLKVDRFNPDPGLRRRPLVGLTFLEGFRYEGDSMWDRGRIYNPENGKLYRARITLDGNDRLMLRGYWGVSLLGRTETWVRCAAHGPPGA